MSGDATEVFVFISGFTRGLVYSRTMERDGFLRCGSRVLHRVTQLYVAHIVMFMTLMAALAHTSYVLNTRRYIHFYQGTEAILNEPGLGLMRILALQNQTVSYMDILPLYIVCLAILPLALAGFRYPPIMVIVASLSLWLAIQTGLNTTLPAWPNPLDAWEFNPFAWQALYVLAAWLGWRSNAVKLTGINRRWLYVAAGSVLGGFLIRLSWKMQGFYGPISTPLDQFVSKPDLGVIRFVNILGLAILVGNLTHPQQRLFATSFARPFVLCGRNSLYVFCVSCLLSFFGQVVLWEVSGRWYVQVAVVTTGISIMVGFAGLLDWLAAAGRQVTPRAQPAAQ